MNLDALQIVGDSMQITQAEKYGRDGGHPEDELKGLEVTMLNAIDQNNHQLPSQRP
jgi:hypothetical protein